MSVFELIQSNEAGETQAHQTGAVALIGKQIAKRFEKNFNVNYKIFLRN